MSLSIDEKSKNNDNTCSYKNKTNLLFTIKSRNVLPINRKRSENMNHYRLGTFFYSKNIVKRKNSKILLKQKSSSIKLNEHLRDEALEKLCTETNTKESIQYKTNTKNKKTQSLSRNKNIESTNERFTCKSDSLMNTIFFTSQNKPTQMTLQTYSETKEDNLNNSEIQDNNEYQKCVAVTSNDTYQIDKKKRKESHLLYLKIPLSPSIPLRKTNLFLKTEMNALKNKKISTFPKLPLIHVNNNNNKHCNIIIPHISKQYSSITQSGFLLETKIEKTNQDRLLIFPNILDIPHFSSFAVLDGHGQNGHFIAELSKDFLRTYYSDSTLYYLPRTIDKLQLKTLVNCISSNDALNKLIKDNNYIIHNAIKQLQTKIKQSEFETEFSGTTLCQIFISDNYIISINIGDSRAILIKKDSVVALSEDHKPHIESEKKRIEKAGGEVHKKEQTIGCDRVWVKDQKYPGIAMSRSLGDLIAKQIGVICEPEIKVFIRDNNMLGIVIASDGVWEWLSNEEVGNIFREGYKIKDANYIVNTLYSKSKESFILKKENIDDISAIAVFLN